MSQSFFISIVTHDFHEYRLDRYLYAKLEKTVSREKVKQAIFLGCCRVDNVECLLPSKRLKVGMEVVLFLQGEKPLESAMINASPCLEVLYQDEYLAIVNKPAGLNVHPAPSVSGETMVDYLLKQFPQIAIQGGERPGIVHRLDKDTSGLICIALTEECRLALVQMFADRDIFKTYLALVYGVPPIDGQLQTMFGRHPTVKVKMAVTSKGKSAETEWSVLFSGYRDVYSLVKVAILTGRTHQIRVHMEHIGHPIVGEQTYSSGSKKINLPSVSRQMLHAWKLAFNHPISGRPLHFSCPPPEDFLSTACALEERPVQVVLTGVAGCGKSLVLSLLEKYGVATWSADKVVERLYSPGGDVWNIFLERYGTLFIPNKRSPIDRHKLWLALSGEFDFSITIHDLTSLVYPFVYHELVLFLEKAFKQKALYTVAEVPLWFESIAVFEQIKKDSQWVVPDVVAGVFCPDSIRHDILRARGWSEDKQRQIDFWHFEQQKKLELCSYVLKNLGDKSSLEIEVERFFCTVENIARKRQNLFKAKWKVLTS